MLKNARKKLGISQLELAKKINVTQSYLSKIENRKLTNAQIEILKNLSKELNLNLVDVLLFLYE